MNSKNQYVTICDSELETTLIEEPQREATIVFLHEGLGCVELWRDFPAELARANACNALLYSRAGHGSSAMPKERRTMRYLHKEAVEVLPELLQHYGLERPILFGHSDGASIALLFAAAFPDSVTGVIVEAPHLFVEDVTIDGIIAAGRKFDSVLSKPLARYHKHSKELFFAWHDTWLMPEFRSWNIEQDIAPIRCPVLAIQGVNDQYGTLKQIERIQELVPGTELYAVSDCGHAPHQEQKDDVLKRASEFISRILAEAEERSTSQCAN